MAYLDLANPPFTSPTVRAQPCIGSVARFTPLEWLVVEIASGDGLSSLQKPGPAATLLRWIFGIRPANILADTRLEALRRISVLGRRLRGDVPSTELKDFLKTGFTLEQYDLLMARIRGPRSALSDHCRRNIA